MKYEDKLYGKLRGKYIQCTQQVSDLENEIVSLKNQLNWVKITGEEDFPKYYDTILLSCLNEDKEQFFNLGYYDHKKEKYILDFGTEEVNQEIEITHYRELSAPE